MKRSGKTAILLLLTLVFVATGCTDNKAAEAEALKIEVGKMKRDACDTWKSEMVGGKVYMSERAAKKFSKLSSADPTYDYVTKVAYTAMGFNGSSVAENLRPIWWRAMQDVGNACQETIIRKSNRE